jgi:acetyl esterase/lipase
MDELKERAMWSKAAAQQANGSIVSRVAAVALVLVAVVALIGSQVAQARQASVSGPPAPVLGVAYATGSPGEVMDIYPSASPGSPLVVLMHGGGWRNNSQKSLTSESKMLQKQGFAVFNVNYPLDSSTVPAFPMQVGDMVVAIEWAIANAATYNADPGDVTVIGGSAGGQLAGMAAEQLNDVRSGTVAGVVTLSGATDFPALFEDLQNKHLRTPLPRDIQQALGCSVTAETCTSALAEQWSPSANVTSSNCPPSGWLIFNSEAELMPLDQLQDMAGALAREGCQVFTSVVSGRAHSFEYWRKVESAVVGFIDSEQLSIAPDVL